MLSLNCKNVQHVKIYLPCNFEVNHITHFGVIAIFSSKCSKFEYFHLISQKLLEIEGKFKLQKCSACQDLQKISPTVENVRQLCEELFLLKCIFFCWLTAFGYSNNQREVTLLQNVK